MVPHTDSNREPTDCKSDVMGFSSLIMYDSKRLWSPPSNKILQRYKNATHCIIIDYKDN